MWEHVEKYRIATSFYEIMKKLILISWTGNCKVAMNVFYSSRMKVFLSSSHQGFIEVFFDETNSSSCILEIKTQNKFKTSYRNHK